MVDTGRLLELVPHYLAMAVTWIVLLAVARMIVGDNAVGFWAEIGLLVVIALAYRPIVLRLGVAPRMWEEE